MVGGRTAATGGTLSAVGRLIERADVLHLRAPELALVLGERAAALAEAAGADEQWIRAESLVVSARVRLGSRPRTVGRAVAALRAAEHAGYGDIAARLRIDLAVCARSVGVPLTGLAALRPLLADPAVSPVHRAEALCHLVGCLAQFGRKAELDRVLAEADKLVVGDRSMPADSQLLIRAMLRVGVSAHRRRHGDLTSAADAARTGLGMLEKLGNPNDDGGLVRVRLILQLVCTLLDRGESEIALEVAQPILESPVRAAGVSPAAWLRLAVATRVLLPAGSGEAAGMLVREAVAGTEDHGLHSVTARLWLELAQIEERLGRPEEAIGCLHRSRAAEHLHARARRQACNVLVGEFGKAENTAVDLDDVLRVVVSRPAAPPMPAEETTVMPAIEMASPKPPALLRRETPAPVQSRPVVQQPRPAEPAIKESAAETPVLKPPSQPEPRREAAASAPGDWRRRVQPKPKPKPTIRFEPKTKPVESPSPSLMPPPQPKAQPKPQPQPEPQARPEPVPVERSRPEIPAARDAGFARPEAPIPTARQQRLEPEMPTRRAEPEPELAVPELLLAPEPAAEPMPRIADSEVPRPPGTAAPLWESDEWAAEERARRTTAPTSRKTRHDAEHGSVAAKSVLDRLGISSSGGHGGGRRRADDTPEPARSQPPAEETWPATGSYQPDSFQPESFKPEPTPEPAVPLAPPPREDPPATEPVSYGNNVREEVSDPWLPKLRMPPALDPLTDTGSWRPMTPFPESYARAIAEDEPPPDAGLADLLARALAEHQAGTASAAALVKQLGSQGSGKRPVNGRDRHHNNGVD